MKKLFVLVSCVAVMFILGKVSFAQSAVQTTEVPAHLQTESSVVELSVDDIVGEARSSDVAIQPLPFGVPPYPTVGGYPAYGVPYSFKQRGMRPRRLAGRFAPPPHMPYPLPMPGAAPGMVPPPMPLPAVTGHVPPCQEMLGPVPVCPAPVGPPTVYYRPTPVKNFMTLLSAPRPYIGYDPYVCYPPFPGYIPPQ